MPQFGNIYWQFYANDIDFFRCQLKWEWIDLFHMVKFLMDRIFLLFLDIKTFFHSQIFKPLEMKFGFCFSLCETCHNQFHLLQKRSFQTMERIWKIVHLLFALSKFPMFRWNHFTWISQLAVFNLRWDHHSFVTMACFAIFHFQHFQITCDWLSYLDSGNPSWHINIYLHLSNSKLCVLNQIYRAA